MERAVSFNKRIADLASDNSSGAATLLDSAVAILRDALAAGIPVGPIARAICRAQPSMAPLWNAALQAAAAEHDPARFDRFAQRVARSGAALVKVGAEYLAASGEGTPSRIVTISNSRSVQALLEAVHRRRRVHVSCSESGPAKEGRQLAAALAGAGIGVTLYSDAAIGQALASADAVLVGADAVATSWFFNKSGTRMLAASATLHGVPVYVAATREKFVADAIAARLSVRDAAPQEIWDDPPAGVTVRNPYFEATPLDLVTAVITDFGVLGAGMVGDVCRSMHDASTLALLDDISAE